MVGETLDGRYQIVRVLGEGGMGAVYEARHTGTGRRVAVKVIRAQMAENVEMVQRFQREARAAGSIETPHIVQVLDTGTDPATGMSYMAMELLRGEDLQHLLRRLGKLPPALALRLVAQACIGLGKAHEAGVIHRDIKPANLFLSALESGEVIVKVVDFGIAKMLEAASPEDAALTHTGGMLGSPLYMSPEQALGKKTIDHRADIWSLGVVLYQALAGRVPHLRDDTVVALMMRICTEPSPSVQDLAPWVPPEVAVIVHGMLAINPGARFASVAAVLEAIKPWLPGGMSIQAGDLASLTPAEQAHVADRAVLSGDEVTVRVGTPLPGQSSSELPLAGGLAALSVSQVGATSRIPPFRSSGLRPWMALPLALGLGGVLFYGLADRSAAPAASAASPEAAPAETAAPPAQELTVRLAVGPADATVEVDGRATAISDGSVELRGAIGSVHHVRVVKGAQEAAGEVAITSMGAVPPRVQVEAAASSAAPRPSGRAAAAPPPAARAPAPLASASAKAGKARHPGLERKFEE